MRSRRGGCVVTRPSHHPARLREHPVRPVALHRDCRSPARRHAPRNPGSPSGRRGIHFIEGGVILRPIKGGVFIDVKATFDAARLKAAGISLWRL